MNTCLDMNKVKEHLKELSLKQNQFAEYVGIKSTTFTNYVNEQRTPNIDIAWRIAIGLQKQHALSGKKIRFEDVFPPDSYIKEAA